MTTPTAPTARASNVFMKNAGDDFLQLIGEGGNVLSWINGSGQLNGNLTGIVGNAASGLLFTIFNTDPILGQNSTDALVQISSAVSAVGTAFQISQYGDGTTELQMFKTGSFVSGISLDVTNAGGFLGNTTAGSVAVGFNGAKGFSSALTSAVQSSVGDILSGVPPNPGEVSWTAGGKKQALQGVSLPLAGYGTNNVDPVIVATTDSELFTGPINTATIYSTNGALTVASASVTSGVVTLTTNQNIPSVWMVGSLINVSGITSTGGNWNASQVAITAIGSKTVSYASATASGVATVSQAVVLPVNGGLTPTTNIVNNSGNNQFIASATHSAGTVQINFTGIAITSQMVTGKVIQVGGFIGDTSINGLWVVTASSGIGASALQYAVAGSGSPTLGPTGTTFVAVPKFYMGQGFYRLEGYMTVEAAGVTNTATLTLTYTDESGLASQTQTASGTFTNQGDKISFNLPFCAAGVTDVKIAVAHAGGTPPSLYQLSYRLVHY